MPISIYADSIRLDVGEDATQQADECLHFPRRQTLHHFNIAFPENGGAGWQP